LDHGSGTGSNIRGEIGATSRSPAALGLLRGRTGLVAIVAAFLGVTVAAGALLAARQRRQMSAGAFGFVGAFVEFRSGELERWLAERRANAFIAGQDSVIAAALTAPEDAGVTAARSHLASLAWTYGYVGVLTIDARGRRIALGDAQLSAEGEHRARAIIARGGDALVGPLWNAGAPHPLVLEIIAPVRAAVGATPVGAVVLRVDLSDVLVKIFGIAPKASRTGEGNLVFRNGGDTFTVYPKRRAEGAGWIVRRPTSPSQSPEAILSRGGSDLSAAVDEDGEPVFAVSRAFPALDAVVVGHIRESEMRADATRSIWLTVGLLALVFLGVALVARYHWIASTREALLAEEEKFKVIFENMQDAYLLSKLDGTILLVNPALVRMLGYAREADLVGKNSARDLFLDKADRARLREQLLQAGSVPRFETTFKRADGTPVAVEGNVRLVRDERGAPVGIEGMIRDITLHRQIRADLTAAREAAEVATHGKSQFLANVSHEIRTPLNAIVGLGHLLLSTELPPKQRDYVGKIHSSARILLRTVDDVLDFSKIEAGKLELERTSFRLDEVLEDIASLLAVQADAKAISFVVTVADDVPRSLIGDPLRLGQVLTNLAGNAIKFTERGGVTLRCALASQVDGEAVVRFSVEDTGIGMSGPQLARIFEPFTQADGSTTRRFGGTGLGLTICRQVVEAMGGHLGATSVPGSGSTFSFEAPFRVSAAEVASAPAGARARGESFLAMPQLRLRGSRVLLVEDNAINQQVARELLEAAGVAVSIADNGRAAVDVVAAAGGALDAVLMDVQMPGMDGVAATRAIRAVAANADLPIIAMTAHAEVTERERCLAAGMNDYVSKPFEPSHLFKTLARWLETRNHDAGPKHVRPGA
jgi:PAS domain S-box-containing protein